MVCFAHLLQTICVLFVLVFFTEILLGRWHKYSCARDAACDRRVALELDIACQKCMPMDMIAKRQCVWRNVFFILFWQRTRVMKWRFWQWNSSFVFLKYITYCNLTLQFFIPMTYIFKRSMLCALLQIRPWIRRSSDKCFTVCYWCRQALMQSCTRTAALPGHKRNML